MPEPATISGPPAKIRLADVGIVFRPRDREPVVAVRDFTFDVPEGSIVTIVGPSGCGKSTLLRLIAGLERCEQGDIEIGGRRANDLAPQDRDIAMIFQNYALYPHMTVRQNIAFGLE